MGTALHRVVIVFACAVAALLPAVASAEPQVPDKDPFYVAPPSLGSYAPGSIIRTREVDVSLGAVPLSAYGAKAYQLLYRTNEHDGDPVANVTTVIVPDGEAPEGGRELISLQDAEDSLTTNCAPSYQLQVGERDNEDMFAEFAAAGPSQIASGRTLVIPDPYGPRSEFLVTRMEAHAVLDSIRAVQRFVPAQVDGVRAPVALVGYSGGGHETMGAAEMQPAYAPELKVVGVAAGGTPVGDPEFYDHIDGAATGVVMGSMIALERADPSVGWTALLNEKGRAFADKVGKGPECVTPVVSGTDKIKESTTVPDPLGVPSVARAIAGNALGKTAPKVPTYLYVSQRDELIPLANEDKLAALYCAGGTRLDYYRDPNQYPVNDHLAAGVAGFIPNALSYLSDRFAGKDPPTTCPPRKSSPGTTTTASKPCPKRVSVRVRLPRGMRVKRLEVRVNGRRVRTLHRRVKSVRITVPEKHGSTLRVRFRVAGRFHGRARKLTISERVRLCA